MARSELAFSTTAPNQLTIRSLGRLYYCTKTGVDQTTSAAGFVTFILTRNPNGSFSVQGKWRLRDDRGNFSPTITASQGSSALSDLNKYGAERALSVILPAGSDVQILGPGLLL